LHNPKITFITPTDCSVCKKIWVTILSNEEPLTNWTVLINTFPGMYVHMCVPSQWLIRWQHPESGKVHFSVVMVMQPGVDRGCQIDLDTKYQNEGEYLYQLSTKSPKMYQMDVIYSKYRLLTKSSSACKRFVFFKKF
jgi:hypothetical protein